MKIRPIWLALIGLSYAAGLAIAAPATHLFIAIPCVDVCPGTPTYFIVVDAGQTQPLLVRALDASGEIDLTYTGTVTFGTTDVLGTVPADYTFTPADRGEHLFLDAALLQTLGHQTLSVTAVTNPAISGAWIVTVRGPGPNTSVPTLGSVGKVLLALLIAGVGGWILQPPHDTVRPRGA